MIITKVEVQKKNKSRVSIFADDEYFGSLDEMVFAQSGLKVGSELTPDYWAELLQHHETRVAFDKALTLLSIRAYAKNELQKKLLEKGFAPEAVETVLQRLEFYGYIDDRAYAQAFMLDKVRLGRQGRMKLSYELTRKGIPEEIRQETLDAYKPEEELEAARRYFASLERRYQRETNMHNKRNKIISALQRQGFSWEVIETVLSDWQEEEECIQEL